MYQDGWHLCHPCHLCRLCHHDMEGEAHRKLCRDIGKLPRRRGGGVGTGKGGAQGGFLGVPEMEVFCPLVPPHPPLLYVPTKKGQDGPLDRNHLRGWRGKTLPDLSATQSFARDPFWACFDNTPCYCCAKHRNMSVNCCIQLDEEVLLHTRLPCELYMAEEGAPCDEVSFSVPHDESLPMEVSRMGGRRA